MKKKLLAITLCVAMAFGLVACGGGGESRGGEERSRSDKNISVARILKGIKSGRHLPSAGVFL